VPRGGRGDSRADTAIAVVCTAVALLLLVLPAGPRDRVAGAIRGNLLGPLALLQDRAVRAGRALALTDSLRAVDDSLAMRALRLGAAEAENARLRSLLGLGRALRWGYTPAEALVGRGDGEAHTLLLSAGARQGVQRLSAVVAADGLVGIIEQVDPTTSVAIIWPHPDFRVSATTLDGSAFGIVTAHQGSGADRWMLELHGVPYRSALRAGTPIVSSGLGGIFPRGILVGTVVRALTTGPGWARSYLVRPAVHPAEITSVMIIAPERSAEGVESVWLAQAEAMQRRVRAAAESLAARALADSVARATALADSLATGTDSLPSAGARR
jgi:rod shape-determining protein MreC